MAKEHSIVDYINSRLTAEQFGSERFQAGSIDGIAEFVPNSDGETEPGIVDTYGNVEFVGIDDTKPFQIYHRVIQPSAEWNIEEDFGDPKNLRESTQMLMIVIGDRTRLQLTAEDIKTGVAASLPLELPKSELNNLGLKAANILPGTFNWNRTEVFSGEFNIKQEWLKTNTIMFSFSYTIETVYDRTCFTLCE
jgi:hypothetical protein